jgi:hypothetical protein
MHTFNLNGTGMARGDFVVGPWNHWLAASA